MKARRSGWIWDIFWSFAGFTGWGRFGEDDEKKKDNGRLGEEHVLGEEIRWFV